MDSYGGILIGRHFIEFYLFISLFFVAISAVLFEKIFWIEIYSALECTTQPWLTEAFFCRCVNEDITIYLLPIFSVFFLFPFGVSLRVCAETCAEISLQLILFVN